MTGPCDVTALEELAYERLPTSAAREVEAHVGSCPSCARELASLRAERALFARRAEHEPSLPPEIWQGVERRIAAPARPAFRPPLVAAAVLTFAAAAAVVLALRPAPPVVGRRPVTSTTALRPDPEHTLDAAEREVREAIAVLEDELAQAQRRGSGPSPRWQRGLAEARDRVAAAPAVGSDPEARLRVLDGYAAYLRSLQTVVLAVEEGAR